MLSFGLLLRMFVLGFVVVFLLFGRRFFSFVGALAWVFCFCSWVRHKLHVFVLGYVCNAIGFVYVLMVWVCLVWFI